MTNTRIIRLLSLVLAMILLLGALPVQAAQPAAAAYAQLNGAEQLLYDYFLDKIQSIANGDTSTTVFEIDGATMDDWVRTGNFQRAWTLRQEVDQEHTDPVKIDYYAQIKQEFKDSFFGQFDLVKVLDALLNDCTYDLYWFDKVAGISYSYDSNGIRKPYYIKVDKKDKVDYYMTTLSMTSIEFTFYVTKDCQKGSNTTVDASDVTAAKKTLDKAKSIVAAHADKSDLEKLQAYRKEICDLTSYDTTAASGGVFGNAWQVTNVFDTSKNTKSVCEGYAKAFQLLCDLSDFESDSVVSHTVLGTVNGRDHMWNVVTMDDGCNYLVDLTNVDNGTAGLFLAGGAGSIADGYTLEGQTYVISDRSKTLWGTEADSALNLAPWAYDPDRHEHNWVYTANGSTISVACTALKCPAPDGGSVTLEIPDILIADGTVKTLTLRNSLTVEADVSVTYDCAGGCSKAGTHTAVLTVGSTSVDVNFTIEAAPTKVEVKNEAIREDGKVTFDVRAPKAEDAVLIVAYYNGGKQIDRVLTNTTTANATHTIPAPTKAWDTCKVFLLKSGVLTPLCENGFVEK